MMRSTMDAGFRRIAAAGIRSFREDHAGIIFEELKHIDDEAFKKAIEELLSREDDHPRNLVAYFKGRARKAGQSLVDFSKCGVGFEYTAEDLILWRKCTREALRIWDGDSDQYRAWGEFLERKFSLYGKDFTDFFKTHLDGLSKQESIRMKPMRNLVFRDSQNPIPKREIFKSL